MSSLNSVLVKVKICCIASIEEARLALRYGADALGLVSAMPSGPGPIPEERIAAIVAALPRQTRTFLLTSLLDADAIAAQQRRCGVTTLQLVDALPPGSHARLRQLLPDVVLVQVIHVNGEESLREAIEIAPQVDALLLDSGRPKLAVKEFGGTGRTHDWNLSREIVEKSRVPVFLAGGLRPANVAEAIATVRPYGVDVCSGLRTEGRLDEAKVAAFVSAMKISRQ